MNFNDFAFGLSLLAFGVAIAAFVAIIVLKKR